MPAVHLMLLSVLPGPTDVTARLCLIVVGESGNAIGARSGLCSGKNDGWLRPVV
jgi:hypothetical protein